MAASPTLEFDHQPFALRFMLNALRSSPALPDDGQVPGIVARWRQHRIDRHQLAGFCELTGLRSDTHVPMIYPHTFGFRLQMVVLTHPRFPIPIWGALQVRNHLLQHRPVPCDRPLDIETRVAGQRILEKGIEVDLHTILCTGSERIWESLNTIYYRGRFGQGGAPSPSSSPPATPAALVASWRLPDGVGWRLARMTGDYNGIHHWHWYARRFGFRRAFFHSQLIAGQCMAQLRGPDPDDPQQLKLWLKGPAYLGAGVSLRAAETGESCVFALFVQGDERPALLGHWCSARTVEGLSDERDQGQAEGGRKARHLDGSVSRR
jgi:hypothetical protein